MSLISEKSQRVSVKTPSIASVPRSGASQMGGTYASRKATALAAKNTAVLSYDELERIKGMCSQTNEEQDYQTMRLNERKELNNLSQARVSKWPNTIQAERERKEYERIKKLEDDEVSIILILWLFSCFVYLLVVTRI